MAESLDTTAPLGGHDTVPILSPCWEERSGFSGVVAGVDGDCDGGSRLAGDHDWGARRCGRVSEDKGLLGTRSSVFVDRRR